MIRLGTRGSALALAQARHVASLLDEPVELVEITTSGDRDARGLDKGRFVKEIEEALLSGGIDLAVHSAKDVPAHLPDGCSIVGVPERADPRDALCGADTLASLPDGARVGTASVRRRSQLLARRPDLQVEELRGNVDTRLRRLREGRFDALVLAAAGLARLDRAHAGTPLEDLVPAPGQGCLALEARSEDEAIATTAAAITDRDSLLCLTAERAVVSALDATCNTPIGVLASVEDATLQLSAYVGMPDGSWWIRDTVSGDSTNPTTLGATLAQRLITAGAADLLAAAERAAS